MGQNLKIREKNDCLIIINGDEAVPHYNPRMTWRDIKTLYPERLHYPGVNHRGCRQNNAEGWCGRTVGAVIFPSQKANFLCFGGRMW